MATNPAREHIEAHLTKLADQRKQVEARFDAERGAYVEALTKLDAELAAWDELLNPPALVEVKPAAKKAAAPKK